MNAEFRRAILPKEIRSLVIFDHKAFPEYPTDWFDQDDWEACEAWWMLVNHRKVGCCAFELHVDFREYRKNPHLHGSLYIVTTGILPRLQGKGFGRLLKKWQLLYARRRGFTRVVTNTRKGNTPIIRLNKKFGFKVIRIARNYYEDPREPTVVMERRL